PAHGDGRELVRRASAAGVRPRVPAWPRAHRGVGGYRGGLFRARGTPRLALQFGSVAEGTRVTWWFTVPRAGLEPARLIQASAPRTDVYAISPPGRCPISLARQGVHPHARSVARPRAPSRGTGHSEPGTTNVVNDGRRVSHKSAGTCHLHTRARHADRTARDSVAYPFSMFTARRVNPNETSPVTATHRLAGSVVCTVN